MARTVCLIMTHGNIASALVEASQRIAGECDDLFAFTIESPGPEELTNDLKSFLENNKDADGIILLVCLKGGSYWNTAVRASREFKNIRVISGVNLPMVLSYIMKRNNLNFNELTEIMCQDSKKGVVVFEKIGV